MTRVPNVRSSPPFFDDPEVHRLIETLANTPALTLFAGAGVSLDRGSPNWVDLVRGLLALQSGGTGEGVDQFLLDNSALIGASAVRQLFEEANPKLPTFELVDLIAQELHRLLYRNWKPGGPLASAIVRLALVWKSLRHDVSIITTNYDSNLEEWAGSSSIRTVFESRRLRIKEFVDDLYVPKLTVPVYHLHGFIPREGDKRGDLAFSEVGLVRGDELLKGTRPRKRPGQGEDWRRDVLKRRLTTSTTVFLGAALTDRTVVEALIETRDSEFLRFAVFPRQGDPWITQRDDVRITADKLLTARLRHLGVVPVRPDYYRQVSQLLTEVIHCRLDCDGKYVADDMSQQRYYGRLEEWWAQWCRCGGHQAANTVADNAQVVLAAARRRIEALLHTPPRETLKVELWVWRGPRRRRELELWASSETSNRRVGRAHRAAITNNSPYVAVQAFCQGYALAGDLPTSNHRWAGYCGVPVVLTGDPWHDLTVGVIDIVSTRPKDGSSLVQLENASVFKDVVKILHAAGRMLLDPDSSVLTTEDLDDAGADLALEQWLDREPE